MTDPAQRRYRDVISEFPTGVTIVTTRGPDGPAGLTTNAITSLSLEPTLLLVCFDNGSRTLAAVAASRRFAVNILAAEQEELASVFASKRLPVEKFEAVTHAEAHGVPVIDGAVAWVACELRELLPGGDHTIGIGEVLGMDHTPGREPLVYHRGTFRGLAEGAGQA